jgi:hypothetical protein
MRLHSASNPWGESADWQKWNAANAAGNEPQNKESADWQKWNAASAAGNEPQNKESADRQKVEREQSRLQREHATRRERGSRGFQSQRRTTTGIRIANPTTRMATMAVRVGTSTGVNGQHAVQQPQLERVPAHGLQRFPPVVQLQLSPSRGELPRACGVVPWRWRRRSALNSPARNASFLMFVCAVAVDCCVMSNRTSLGMRCDVSPARAVNALLRVLLPLDRSKAELEEYERDDPTRTDVLAWSAATWLASLSLLRALEAALFAWLIFVVLFRFRASARVLRAAIWTPPFVLLLGYLLVTAAATLAYGRENMWSLAMPERKFLIPFCSSRCYIVGACCSSDSSRVASLKWR